MKSIRTRTVLLAAVAVVAVVAGAGSAAIPDSQTALVSGCYEKKTGILRVIDVQAGKSCGFWETPLAWSQRGPAGLQGAPGPAGPKGDRGEPGAPAPLYSAGTGLALVGTEFQLAFDPATQSELDAEAAARAGQTAALRDQVEQLEDHNLELLQQIATLRTQMGTLNESLQLLRTAITVTSSQVVLNRSLHVNGSISNPRTTIP